MTILTLAMPVPLRNSFDYLPPHDLDAKTVNSLQPGIRIMAPFGNRNAVGILIAVKPNSDVPVTQLKPIQKILDQKPIFTETILNLVIWSAGYYHHPLGDALAYALPTLLRKGKPLAKTTETRWRLSAKGKGLPTNALKRAAKQAQLLSLLQSTDSINKSDLQTHSLSLPTVKALITKELINEYQAEQVHPQLDKPLLASAPKTLNEEQQHAVDTIRQGNGFSTYLLEGITGSGKTEVYLQLIEKHLVKGQQVLVLIPEIGLTPQTFGRFQNRFNCKIVLLNSSMSDRDRLLSWQQAKSAEAGIIIGTRSAVFTPIDNLGLIIIDEEHDSSFKQQDGFRYSARDIAIKYAANVDCPIVLGSATPSLETLNNALLGRYQHIQLQHRATGAAPPTFKLIDIRHAPMDSGFSPDLLSAIKTELNQGNQVLVFINRRGFSPVFLCHDCGYIAHCDQCDARMTVHLRQRVLRCHHCEARTALPSQCPDCNSSQLDFIGSGTERSEYALQRLFPDSPVVRIDRDTTSRKNAMQQMVTEIQRGEPCIMVGTQMLAKGHHFPDVTLVAVIDADGALFSADFRGPEKMAQLLVQVAGRAGREKKPGTVMIQTHQPEHPLITNLLNNSYHHYARQLLTERQSSHMPPFSHLALVRAEANNIEQPESFLNELRMSISADHPGQLIGPLPAPMTRKAGQFRAHLLIQSKQRGAVHESIKKLCNTAEQSPLGKKVRWSIDIDPLDIF